VAQRIGTVHTARQHRDRGPVHGERGPVRTAVNPEGATVGYETQ